MAISNPQHSEMDHLMSYNGLVHVISLQKISTESSIFAYGGDSDWGWVFFIKLLIQTIITH